MKKILIPGAGLGGLETATGLEGILEGGYDITLGDDEPKVVVAGPSAGSTSTRSVSRRPAATAGFARR